MSEPMNDNLYVDPDEMDFSSLVDEGDFPEDYSPQRTEDEEEYEDDYEDEGYDDPNDLTEDLTGNLDDDDLAFNPHNGMAPDDYFLTLDDDAVLPFGNNSYTKAQLNEIVSNAEFAKTNADFYRAQDAFAFNNYNNYIADVLDESISETARSIQWLQTEISNTRSKIQSASEIGDWNAVNTLKTTLADHTLNLQEYSDKKAVLDQRNAEIKQMRDVQANQIFASQRQETDTYMFSKYGTKWNQEAHSVYDWAQSKGLSYEKIRGALCPFLAETLMLRRDAEINNMNRKNQNIGTVQKQIKGMATSRTPRKTTNRSNQSTSVAKRNAQFRQKMSTGGLTQDEAISMFSGLVD